MQTFFSLEAISVGFIILSIIVIVLVALLIRMHLKLKKFLVGPASNVNDSIGNITKDLDEVKNFRAEMETYLTSVEKRLTNSVQSVHTVRFNPFKGIGAGGNQSFATVFLDEKGNGVLLSSLYSRERVSVYSKPIVNKTSEHELSEEEKEALDKAIAKLAQDK